jgi:TonB family protein
VQKKVEPTKEQVKTQDYDDAPEIKSEEQKKKEAEEKKIKLEEKRKREEEQRLKREEEERQRKIEEERIRKEEEERKRQEEIDRQKKAISSNVSNAFGKNRGSSTSEGVNKGSGNQGYVTGDPNSKNYSGTGQGSKGDGFQLKGRSLQGSLPKPAYDIQEEGIVVVEITVDRTGRVVSAKYTLRGSTTQDSRLKAAAQKAALKARFNADPNASAYVKGTITYHFELD